MNERVRPYRDGDAEAWDDLVARSWNGTFIHTRRYLSYHHDRFRDASWVVEGKQGRLAAVFPAAHHPQEAGCVVSHPGITFGGLVHAGRLRGTSLMEVVRQIGLGLRAGGAERLRYIAVPSLYHRVPVNDDLYALFRLGANRSACSLTATMPLAQQPRETALRRRVLRRAESESISTAFGPAYLEEFWAVLEAGLRDRHRTAPVHTLAEMTTLRSLFPTRVHCVVAIKNGHVLAGVLLFAHPHVFHMQYMGSSELGRQLSATDVALRAAIDMARKAGCTHFDFGTSNELEGRVLNDALFWYKTSFGAGSFVHESYDLDLSLLAEGDH